MTYIRKSLPEDLIHVSTHMRKADCMEISASSNSRPIDSLMMGYKSSLPSCYSIVNDMITRNSVYEDVGFISQNLRQADLDEIEALGRVPEQAIEESFFGSKPHSYTGEYQGVPMAMFGVVPFEENPKWGSIWLLGTDDVTDGAPISFLKWTKLFFPILIEPYEMVCNIVDKRNEVHIKWIKWLGFKFIREITHGPNKRTFYEFARLNHV
tara:strand:- start:1772 stop:2401 length:630 start_codon:yes stop_codon:yes gene_type:complete